MTPPDNRLYYGDNLDVLRKKVADASVDLCYIDPPFNSKRNYNQIYNNIGEEDRAQAQAFTDTWTWDSWADKGYKEILANDLGLYPAQTVDLIQGLEKVLKRGDLLAYLVSMTQRIAQIHRVLKPTGSFFLHCDPTASHYLKLILDGIFCSQGGDFENEIIWSYKRYTAAANRFQRLHDVILFYTKGEGATFNDLREDYGAKSGKADSHYKLDEDGKWFRWQKRKGQEPYKIFLSEGRRVGDVWEIPLINASAKERLGYPTQKPEALLERIIGATTNEGDVVLDAYCGCGTTIAVAQRMKRRWIGMDITYQSIALILRRLEPFGAGAINQIKTDGIPRDMKSALALRDKKDDRLRKEFEKWAVLTYTNNRAIINDKKGADGGLDGTAYFMTGQDTNAKVVFQVKSGGVQRGDIAKLRGDMEREKAELAVLITLEEPSKPMVREAKGIGGYLHAQMAKEYDRVSIVTVKEIVEDGKRLDIPMSLEVLAKAQQSADADQIGLL